MESNPGVYRDLEELGYGQSLSEFFGAKEITQNFPEAVRQAVTVDGEIKKIPVGVHIDGMVYYNLAVAEQAGVDPESWGSMEEMFADFEKIRRCRIRPAGGRRPEMADRVSDAHAGGSAVRRGAVSETL